MSSPLSGVRILDLTHFVAGPWCTMLLADLGAEVVKVEPLGGEIGRSMGSVYTVGESAIFLGFNRSKRSISLDLKKPEGLAAALRLAAEADVVVQNFRPGTAERLGLGATELRARHPRLIYCTVSAFGSEGPYAARPANDPIIQALSGAMAASAPTGGAPVRMGVSVPDFAAGVLAATGILAAIHRRTETETGCLVELNLLDAQLYAQTDLLTGSPTPDREPTTIRGVYVCADGLALWIDTETPIAEWAATGETASTNITASSGTAEKQEKIAAMLRTRPRSHWLNVLGPDATGAVPVLGLSDALGESRVRTLEVSHPTIGCLRQARTPVTADPPWPIADAAPPRLGEHTREVLRELGFPETEIERMVMQGSIYEPKPHP